MGREAHTLDAVAVVAVVAELWSICTSRHTTPLAVPSSCLGAGLPRPSPRPTSFSAPISPALLSSLSLALSLSLSPCVSPKVDECLSSRVRLTHSTADA